MFGTNFFKNISIMQFSSARLIEEENIGVQMYQKYSILAEKLKNTFKAEPLKQLLERLRSI